LFTEKKEEQVELTPYEQREPDEDEMIVAMIAAMKRQQERDYPPGATGRAAHAKHTALLEMSFAVHEDIPAHLRVGVFAEPRVYQGYLRFSNGNGAPQPDGIKDLRGAALKLHGVDGEHIPESDELDTQDFILLNTPAIPLGTVRLFTDVITLSQAKFAARTAVSHPHVLAGLAKAVITPSSPADIPYWSNVAALLGPDQVVKYSIVPTSEYTSPAREKHDDNFLGDHLEQHLAQGPVTFDFKIQLRTDPQSMPVEDIAVEWSETASVPVTVATVIVQPQPFRTAARNSLAEELAFSPAHALVEHRPIGAVARARIAIYAQMVGWRHDRDGRTGTA
jgi:hypothetical protein